jgi:hypothetical protein
MVAEISVTVLIIIIGIFVWYSHIKENEHTTAYQELQDKYRYLDSRSDSLKKEYEELNEKYKSEHLKISRFIGKLNSYKKKYDSSGISKKLSEYLDRGLSYEELNNTNELRKSISNLEIFYNADFFYCLFDEYITLKTACPILLNEIEKYSSWHSESLLLQADFANNTEKLISVINKQTSDIDIIKLIKEYHPSIRILLLKYFLFEKHNNINLNISEDDIKNEIEFENNIEGRGARIEEWKNNQIKKGEALKAELDERLEQMRKSTFADLKRELDKRDNQGSDDNIRVLWR